MLTGGPAATAGRTAAATEAFVGVHVKCRVVVGQLLTLLDVAQRDLEPEFATAAVRFAGVVEVAAMIPTQHPATMAIMKGPVVNQLVVTGRQGGHIDVGHETVELIHDPCNSAARYTAGSDDPVADDCVNDDESGGRMNH